MTALHEAGLRGIVDARAPWCVSIYGDADEWIFGDRPLFAARAQIRTALHDLESRGAPPAVRSTVRDLLSEAAVPRSGGGIAVDRRARSVGVFATVDDCTALALPTWPEREVWVSDRFLVGPLIGAALATHPPGLVLAVSERRARLVDATSLPAREIAVPGMPVDLESTAALDVTGDREGAARSLVAVDEKERLRDYSRAIQRAIEPELRKREALLVIAAAQPLAGMLRVAVSADDARAALLLGNYDDVAPTRLAELAEPLLAELRAHERRAELRRLWEAPPERVISSAAATQLAVTRDEVDTLFIDTEWRSLLRSPGSRAPLDLGDELIRLALSHGTRIVSMTGLPTESTGPVCALLRRSSTPDRRQRSTVVAGL